ncbi:MAG: alpha/beta hydrolase [Patulibacter minatonensis]
MRTSVDTTPAGRVRVGDGHALRTLEWGAAGAPVALLLHGMPGGAEDWLTLGALLSRRHHVVAVDRPGYGGSGSRTLPLGQQVAAYAGLLGALGGAPALVVGHSYGAIPAAVLAAEHPRLVGALGLIAPALRERGRDRAAPPGVAGLLHLLERPGPATVVASSLLSRPGRALLARLLDPPSFRPDPVDAEHRAGVRDRTLRLGAIRSALREALALEGEEAHADELLAAISAPTAVIHGRGDRVVHPSAGARAAESIGTAELHELAGGHMVTISRAREVDERLADLTGR